jgi:hypothetical protein
MFAQACQLEIPDEDLICDACPAGRDEADLLDRLPQGRS